MQSACEGLFVPLACGFLRVEREKAISNDDLYVSVKYYALLKYKLETDKEHGLAILTNSSVK